MKKVVLAVFLVATCTCISAQDKLAWNGTYQLQLRDFHSPGTEVGSGAIYSVYCGIEVGFNFSMTNIEFMATKNFNDKVTCTFNRSISYVVAPDSSFLADLLNFARYQFDLSELNARKLRKGLYDKKKAFSSSSFFQPVYDSLNQVFSERLALAAKSTDLGRNQELLLELHHEVLDEIGVLVDFCRECQPPRKKKK